MHSSLKKSILIPDSAGDIVSLIDDYKFIKMDVKGPDLLQVHHIQVPENIKVLLEKISLTGLKTFGLKQESVGLDLSSSGNWVPVVYLYETHSDDEFGKRVVAEARAVAAATPAHHGVVTNIVAPSPAAGEPLVEVIKFTIISFAKNYHY